MTEQRDVVIVGAGPVGFVTALGLARQGIDVTLIDAEPGIVNSPRAAIYHPVTMELLDRLGVIDDCMAIAFHCHGLAMRYPETGDIIAFNYEKAALPEQKYKFNLHFGQHELAAVIADHLARLPNTRVHWNHRLEGLVQDGERVMLGVETPDGRKQISARWVIGADGARSTVRHLLGLPFEGFTWPERFIATNVEVDLRALGYFDTNMVIDPVNWAVIARLSRGNLWRLTYGEDGRLDEETMWERVPAHYRAFMPPETDYKIVQAAPYRCHERSAPSFRVDRVLLAGDAAHACNPCGGLGLTTGLMDANALFQLLGAVMHGHVGEEALDHYARERRRIFLEITSPSAQHFKKQMSEPDPAVRAQQREATRKAMENPSTATMSAVISRRIVGGPLPVGAALAL
ncbi:FAD-dependent oxidoreductase [Sphingobium nicotianae]|uniref:FAD-dependent monooxygenase n=1 Tax=Sphingobium nicotianae TaxID=2782607 RepID=A0A9X1D8K9_9SPHN|nr:FAD-dependent oxidoreductase [Sphingobium nicotianae]MBT2185749.1 FAD-dependent monooxygenase [Sphingobium nicotianae]